MSNTSLLFARHDAGEIGKRARFIAVLQPTISSTSVHFIVFYF